MLTESAVRMAAMSEPWEEEELVGYSTYDGDKFTSGPKLSSNSTLTTSALTFLCVITLMMIMKE